jgi:NAD(P)-dependent dehydrogenase (short-subunit alcohol dehydrogenase family)
VKLGRDTVAVITGGGSGIGLALAQAVAARGGRVAIGDIDEAKALEAAASLGERAKGYSCDVTEPVALAGFARAVQSDFGGADLLFANAGVVIGGTLVDTDPREVEWLYDVNVRGVISTIQTFHPLLAARQAETGAAWVVLTGSENSLGLPAMAPSSIYTSTKHAVLALADALRRDFAQSGIGVSILCPGLTATRLWDSRAARQDRYGGARSITGADADRARDFIESAGQDPALTARICLDGIEAEEFLIITDPAIRQLAERRAAEVAAALDRLDERMSAYTATQPA